jgi:hypothetical protein
VRNCCAVSAQRGERPNVRRNSSKSEAQFLTAHNAPENGAERPAPTCGEIPQAVRKDSAPDLPGNPDEKRPETGRESSTFRAQIRQLGAFVSRYKLA